MTTTRPARRVTVRTLARAAARTFVLFAAAAFVAAASAPASSAPARPAATSNAASKASARRKQRNAATRAAATRPAEPPADASAPLPADPREAQQQQSAEHERLTARIAELRRQIAAGERSRSGASVALRHAEQALADVDRRLAELARRQRDIDARSTGLARQRAGTDAQIAARQDAWARSALLVSAGRETDPLTTFVGGGDPAAALRTEADLVYYAKAQDAELSALHARVDDLDAQRRRVDEDSRTLAVQSDAERSARQTLAADQAAQREALAQLSQRLAAQRDAATKLEADEKRLSRVVEQLQKAIERQAAADAKARRDAAKRAADAAAAAATADAKTRGRRTPRSATQDTPRDAARPTDEPSTGDGAAAATGAFARLRGRLALPARGTVTGRFGTARGTSGATWKGVFVRTDSGADVRAVAAGRVIFADDLRGFGNLLIVDHGDQYLSIYGNNDALLRRAGDAVAAGDVIAKAGNSSGDEQTGLYFELRYRGRPFDPLGWTAGR